MLIALKNRIPLPRYKSVITDGSERAAIFIRVSHIAEACNVAKAVKGGEILAE